MRFPPFRRSGPRHSLRYNLIRHTGCAAVESTLPALIRRSAFALALASPCGCAVGPRSGGARAMIPISLSMAPVGALHFQDYPDLFGGTLSVIRDICAGLKDKFDFGA